MPSNGGRHYDFRDDEETLKPLFPASAFWQVVDAIARIARITEDKTMYDTREKVIRDQQWLLNSACAHAREEGRAEGRAEGHAEGEIEMIHILQEILGIPISDESSLSSQSVEQRRTIIAELRAHVRRPQVSQRPASEQGLGVSEI